MEPETPEEVAQYTCGFLMFLFGTTLFADRGNTVGLYLLSALVDLSQLWVHAYFPTLAPELEVEVPLTTPYSLVFEGHYWPRPRESFLHLRQYFDTVRSSEITWQPWAPLGRDLRFQFAGAWGVSRYRILFEGPVGRAWFLGDRFLRQVWGYPTQDLPSAPPDDMRTADRLTPQEAVSVMLGTDAVLHLEEGEYATYRHTYLMPSLTGVHSPTRRSAGMPSSSRARTADIPSTSRASTSRGGGGLVPPIPLTHFHARWPEIPTELTGWRYGTSYPIPKEPPRPDHRFVRDPDSPPPPIEYMDEMLGLVASLEGMVLRREAQLSIMGVQMPPVYTQPQAGPSRPRRGAGPSGPSRGVRRGGSSRKCRAQIIEEEASEEEEAVDRQSETSADRKEGSDPGSGSGDEAEEGSEDGGSDSDDADGDDGVEAVPQKRTKRASYSCS
ncbi:hypothetical protein ACSBR2_015103 [Camellia fascicularis]